MLQELSQQFPPPHEPVLDKATGGLSQVFRFFFQSLFNRTGVESGIFPKINQDTLAATGSTQADALALDVD